MAIYKVTITEISTCRVEVEANSEEEAIQKIEADYSDHANEFLLEPEDTTFEAEEV